MPRKGQSEEKIVYALRQSRSAQKVTEVCREIDVVLVWRVDRWGRSVTDVGSRNICETG
jgi:DNA invertase Pin-like site-specific DNA recombinase